MKASVLIKKLQEQVEKHGDRDVCFSHTYTCLLCEGVKSVTYEELTSQFEDATEEENYIAINITEEKA